MTPNISTSASRRFSQGKSRVTRSKVQAQNLPPNLNRQYAWHVAASLQKSFSYALDGVIYAFQTQRNFKIHTVVGALAIALGIYLHLRPEQLAVLVLTIAFVMGAELINTAIESVVDLTVKQTYHELAKVAKDCAAAAVLISAIASVCVALFLYIPAIWLRFFQY